MTNYQIKLTPINHYFFGAEKHSKNKSTLGFEMDYFAQSQYYPQQTTLLGTLRYFLLLKNNLLNPNNIGKETEANKLIGEKSFAYDTTGTPQNFGKIKSISPLYFMFNQNKYIIAPKDIDYKVIKKFENYILENYNPKKELQNYLININDINNKIPFFKKDDENIDGDNDNYVFMSIDTVGNKKGNNGISEDDGFYKQTSYKLNNDWSFAFDAELDIDNLCGTKEILSVGAEQNQFLIECTKIDNKTKLEIDLQRELPAIFCLSDCFVENTILSYSVFSINAVTSFRNLQSSNSSQNYSSFSKGYHRSNRFQLLQRGSILYFKDETSRDTNMRSFKNTNAENVGFNHILKINNNK